MGKPKGRNPFFHYLIHTQNELKKEGKNYGINDQRLQQMAGDKWKGMTKEEREPFDSKSRAEKERAKGVQQIPIQPRNYNERTENFGKVLTQSSHEIDDEDCREEYLDKMIECCVNACTTTDQLMNASFFLISSNVMLRTDDNKFLPLEIGICQYSIRSGIQFNYHEFIDAGKVPMGYMSRAQDWMRDSHKIPLENFIPAKNNYQRIVEDIQQILNESRFTNETTGKPTPMLVFSDEEQIEQNRGVFDWFKHKYREQANAPAFEWDLEVLDLVNLLYHISNRVQNPISPAIGSDLLSSSAFDYSMNTNCAFHEEMDNMNCAQGKTRRLCYLLSQSLCPLFGVNPTENHLPPKRENVVAETYVANLQEVKPMPSWRYQSNSYALSDADWAPNERQERDEPNTSRPQSRTPMAGVGRGRGLLGAQNQRR